MEVYPSPAEGIGLENRQGCKSPRGFESLYLLHYFFNEIQLKRIKLGIVIVTLNSVTIFLYMKIHLTGYSFRLYFYSVLINECELSFLY